MCPSDRKIGRVFRFHQTTLNALVRASKPLSMRDA